jgi:outer membrane receptor protein involved in Fe transport
MRLAPAAALLAVAIAGPPPLLSQRDSGGATVLDTVLVTAERVPTALGAVSAAVTRIGAAQLARLPNATFADLLRLAPGFALVDFDGLGHDPQLMVRGFYGGGEAEYVVVMLDGRPVGQLHTGLVAWDALPPANGVEAVEIVRGSSSALYGDAAVGAVINVITRPAGAPRPPRWSAAGGTHGSWRGSADVAGTVLGRAVALSGGVDGTGGFRAHARRTAGRVRADVALLEEEATRLSLFAHSHWREFEEPGPLLDSLFASSRDASDALFRFDRTRDAGFAVGVEGRRRMTGGARLGAAVTAEHRATGAIRTLALAPGFGDTKDRETTNRRAAAGLQLDLERLTVGIEVSRGASDSRYYAVVTGDRDAYRAADGARDSLETAGDATRGAAALFAQYGLPVSGAVRLSLGARFDHLTDAYDPRSPAASSRMTASHGAFSPKAGLNVRYLQGARASGSAYLTASRSFKAPTLDQLFDQRIIPLPLPPYAGTISNPQLVPQHGTSVETGLYHDAPLGAAVRVVATFSAYQMDMKDELDFDLQDLRYVNIGRSRHRGIEAGLTLTGPGAVSVFTTYTLQAVTARSGDNAGKVLKAVPKHAWTAGLAVSPSPAVDARLILSHARHAYLDDANTVRLPPYTRVDASLAYRRGATELFVDGANLFGARYSTTGFLDPSGEAYYYPAAERTVRIGLRRGP